MFSPLDVFPANSYFKDCGLINIQYLHNYWASVMRSKGANISEMLPGRESPFYYESYKYKGINEGDWRIDDEALDKYVDELKKAIDESDPTPRGQKKFKAYMKKFYLSLPDSMVHNLSDIDYSDFEI